MKACPGCPDCAGRPHHWLRKTKRDGRPLAFECKHCKAVGKECPDCGGFGDGPAADDTMGPDGFDESTCGRCSGVGVILAAV